MRPYYEQDGITIYHGDCRDMLSNLETVDHIITDPPYDDQTHEGAMAVTSKSERRLGAKKTKKIAIDFDPLDVASMLPVMLALSKRWTVSFCALEMLGEYKRVGGDAYIRGGFWRRSDGAPQFTGDRPAQPGEGIAILHRPLSLGRVGRTRWNGGGCHAFYEFMTVKAGRVHPTQKPEPLMAAIVSDFTEPGELILDPFAGSCSTLLAAKRLGRRAIGIEIEEKYCEDAARHLSQSALPLFLEAS